MRVQDNIAAAVVVHAAQSVHLAAGPTVPRVVVCCCSISRVGIHLNIFATPLNIVYSKPPFAPMQPRNKHPCVGLQPVSHISPITEREVSMHRRHLAPQAHQLLWWFTQCVVVHRMPASKKMTKRMSGIDHYYSFFQLHAWQSLVSRSTGLREYTPFLKNRMRLAAHMSTIPACVFSFWTTRITR
jgi:hypothetical protein